MVGYNAFKTAASLMDKMVVVKEEWIALAILRLVEQEKSNFYCTKNDRSTKIHAKLYLQWSSKEPEHADWLPYWPDN